MTLIRLVEQKTDIIVAINVPHIAGQYDEGQVDFEAGKEGSLIEGAMAYREKLLEGFEIKDWGLFVQE